MYVGAYLELRTVQRVVLLRNLKAASHSLNSRPARVLRAGVFSDGQAPGASEAQKPRHYD